jgi:hypothetical protein
MTIYLSQPLRFNLNVMVEAIHTAPKQPSIQRRSGNMASSHFEELFKFHVGSIQSSPLKSQPDDPALGVFGKTMKAGGFDQVPGSPAVLLLFGMTRRELKASERGRETPALADQARLQAERLDGSLQFK